MSVWSAEQHTLIFPSNNIIVKLLFFCVGQQGKDPNAKNQGSQEESRITGSKPEMSMTNNRYGGE